MMNHSTELIRKIKITVFATAGVLSLIYYTVCIAYARIGVSWLWIWPLLAMFCFIRAFMLWKKLRVPKPLKIIYRAAILCFCLLFTVVEGKIISFMGSEPEPGLDYIITLGASVRGGNPTSPMLLRINAAVDYLQDNPETVLIASGGKGTDEPVSEAECIAAYAIEAGIDPDRITIEDQSHNTEENIRNSFKYVPAGSSVGVVTSSFHLYRAIRIAELQGYQIFPVPAKTLLPLGIHYTVREFFAVIELEVKKLVQNTGA